MAVNTERRSRAEMADISSQYFVSFSFFFSDQDPEV
jgi:hypothetical protein